MGEHLVDVLLVEDHELVRGALSIAMELSGLKLAVATSFSAEAVLALAEEVRPRVVVLDYYLEGEAESLPMVAPLVAQGATVLVLTGTSNAEVRRACLAAGAADVLDKTVGFETLIDRVKST